MAGQTWSINIVAGEPPFVPDVYPGNLTTLKAQQGDSVSWANKTDALHQPWQTTDGTYEQPLAQLTPIIDPRDNSESYAIPLTGTPPYTIYYRCNIHPNEHGTIEVVA